MEFIDIDSQNSEHIKLLKRFYNNFFVAEFPDENERESLENFVKYLTLKQENFYGTNNYHIVICTNKNEIVGATIFDYYSQPNCGVVEYLIINKNYRGLMTLQKMFYNMVNTLQADAKNTKQNLDFILTETNNPHKTLTDSVNPALRLALFNRGGFNILDFNYLQPPLEEGKNPVTSLLLLTKTFNQDYLQNGIPKEKVLGAINSFFKYAFNINNPTQNTFYKQMENQINHKFTKTVTTIPFKTFMKPDSQQNL